VAKKTPRAAVIPDRVAAAAILKTMWNAVLSSDEGESTETIKNLIASKQVAIRYCLPTQILGKLTDHGLDIMCLQAGKKEAGQWDPRGFAAKVVSPWVVDNQKVLGSSADPYVSNPLRRPRLDDGLDQMSDRDEWESLCGVLREIQTRNDPDCTKQVFIQVLNAIRDRLRELTFVYVVPPRVSLKQAEDLVERFLAEKSGGDRGLAVAAALFETFREKLGLYQDVRRGVINAADAATVAAADLECIGADGEIVLAVEVKERRIGDADVHIAVAKARAFAVQELLLCTEGILTNEQAAVEKTFANAWASGTNVYHVTLADLMRGALPLLGERGTRNFVTEIGSQLDRFSTQPRHRKAWKALLDDL
jgi:hypothetical protein